MTGIASVASGDMGRGFAGGGGTVMAGRAGAGDCRMGEVGGCPGGGAVASTALCRGGDMGSGFSGGRRSIMTRGARAYDRAVIDLGYGIPGAR